MVPVARLLVCMLVVAAAVAETAQVSEDFSADPKWDGRNNLRTVPGREKTQDFGIFGRFIRSRRGTNCGSLLRRRTSPIFVRQRIHLS